MLKFTLFWRIFFFTWNYGCVKCGTFRRSGPHYVSCVRYNISHVTCQVSCVMCCMFLFLYSISSFSDKVVELVHGRSSTRPIRLFFLKSKVCVQQFAFHVLFTELAPMPIQSKCQVGIRHLVIYIYIFVVMWEFESLIRYLIFLLFWLFNKTLRDCKTLHKGPLIGCQGVKLFLPKDCFNLCPKLSCQNLSFWGFFF